MRPNLRTTGRAPNPFIVKLQHPTAIMAKILILFAHPALEKSRIHRSFIKHIKDLDHVTFHDLYELYPDFDVNVKREQELLLRHDIIIWQHPFYWYSCPALIKQWQDLVLEHGWAYGRGGTALTGKRVFNVISCAGSREVYRREGKNRFTINELLAPFDQTAFLCHMEYMPPFVVHSTPHLSDVDLEVAAVSYRRLLVALAKDYITADKWKSVTYINELSDFSSIN